jgi:hypothetical protein
LLLQRIVAGEHEVERLAAQRHLPVAGEVQQVLGLVRERLNFGEREHARHALDRVERPVHGVQRLRVGGARVEGEQVPVHGFEVLVGFGAEVRQHRAVLFEHARPGVRRERHLVRRFAEAARRIGGALGPSAVGGQFAFDALGRERAGLQQALRERERLALLVQEQSAEVRRGERAEAHGRGREPFAGQRRRDDLEQAARVQQAARHGRDRERGAGVAVRFQRGERGFGRERAAAHEERGEPDGVRRELLPLGVRHAARLRDTRRRERYRERGNRHRSARGGALARQLDRDGRGNETEQVVDPSERAVHFEFDHPTQVAPLRVELFERGQPGGVESDLCHAALLRHLAEHRERVGSEFEGVRFGGDADAILRPGRPRRTRDRDRERVSRAIRSDTSGADPSARSAASNSVSPSHPSTSRSRVPRGTLPAAERNRASVVSSACVRRATASRPTTSAPPFMVCAERNASSTAPASLPASRRNSAASSADRWSAASAKNERRYWFGSNFMGVFRLRGPDGSPH